MRTTLSFLFICANLVGCNTIPEPVVLAATSDCITREASIGSNFLKRKSCVIDDGDHREERERAEGIRDDQRSRELSKRKAGS